MGRGQNDNPLYGPKQGLDNPPRWPEAAALKRLEEKRSDLYQEFADLTETKGLDLLLTDYYSGDLDRRTVELDPELANHCRQASLRLTSISNTLENPVANDQLLDLIGMVEAQGLGYLIIDYDGHEAIEKIKASSPSLAKNWDKARESLIWINEKLDPYYY